MSFVLFRALTCLCQDFLLCLYHGSTQVLRSPIQGPVRMDTFSFENANLFYFILFFPFFMFRPDASVHLENANVLNRSHSGVF